MNNRLMKLEWPSQSLLSKCLPQSACPLSCVMGVEGTVIHQWTPSNIDPGKRSFCHRNIALITFPNGPITLEGHCVAIWEDLGLDLKQGDKRNRPRQGESQRLQILVRVNHNVFRSSSGRGESQCLQILQWNAANHNVYRSSSGMLEG
ncbi:unnamed protein product [Rodentolepis nana]|uniref:Uncharacterized protein n=1 Tax=Rodentolepis nana TaxID=102285 RepID=A0A3P7V450_RODNA|nr:unnamed protein product [Rodentolepis nana]